MDKYELLLTLNDLLRTSSAGEARFRSCARYAENINLKALLEAAADRCAAGADQLRAKIRDLGGDPRSVDSVSSSIGMDDDAILAECERDEQMAKDEYEAALDADLPLDVKAIVVRHYRVVAKNHRQMRILRNAA
jgi:uncharacterized protein (TIGR02284 family)